MAAHVPSSAMHDGSAFIALESETMNPGVPEKLPSMSREVYFKKYIVGTGNVKSLNGQGEYFHVMVTLVDENDVFNAP